MGPHDKGTMTMADDFKPMTDADTETPADTDRLRSAAPVKETGDHRESSASDGRAPDAKQAVRDGVGNLSRQATDKLRLVADDGKARAGGALDQLSQVLNDAADQVDEKLGAQYGQYARNAAGQVQGFADTVRDKSVDELLDDARGFVRASPAAAIGVAAALGFAVARLISAGVEDARA